LAKLVKRGGNKNKNMNIDGLVKDIGRSFLISSFLPSAFFVSAAVVIFKDVFPNSLFENSPVSIEWAFAIITIWIAFALYSLLPGTKNLFQGYYFPGWVGRIMIKSLQKLHKKQKTNLDEFNKIKRRPRTRRMFKSLQKYRAQAWAEYVNLEFRFPIDEKFLLPTRFGNLMRSCLIYPQYRYNINGDVVWPRLVNVLPKEFVGEKDDAEAQLIFLLNSSLLSFLIGFVALIVGIASKSVNYRYLTIGILFLIFGYFIYRLTLSAGETFILYVRAAFDLYRFELLKQLKIDLPKSRQEEKDLWGKISELLAVGDELGLLPISMEYCVLDSSSKCNKLMPKEYLKRGSKIKAFSRAKVDAIHDSGFFLKREDLKATRFGHILSDQPICVFVGATFPGSIRMSEVEMHRQGLRDFQVGGKLFAIIGCNAFQRSYPFEQCNHRLSNQVGLFAGDTAQQRKTRFALGQCDDHTLLVFSKHQIYFPIPETGALFDDLRTLLNTLAIGDFAPTIMLTITLTVLLLTAQMGPQSSTSSFVCINVLVDMLMADRNAFFLQPSRNLFRTPVFTDLCLNQCPGFRPDPRLCFFSPPFQSHLVSLFRTIATPSSVTQYFSTDARFVEFQLLRYFCLTMTYIQERFYLVSLFSGKLCVTHKCSFDLVV
jgi:hypothetical protein